MARAQNPNVDIFERAIERLGDLADEMVFLGGCATGLLLTDVAAPPIRETRDVDAIVQAVSLGDYYRISDRLRAAGFSEDTSEGAPICRWRTDDVLLDVMPTDRRILGFGGRWYEEAMKNARVAELPSGKRIRMVSAPYFLITKLDAFAGRGSDYVVSHDMEDLIAVLDGRPEVVQEVEDADWHLSRELGSRFQGLLNDPRFLDAVSAHLPGDEANQARVPLIIRRIESLVEVPKTAGSRQD